MEHKQNNLMRHVKALSQRKNAQSNLNKITWGVAETSTFVVISLFDMKSISFILGWKNI